MHLGGDLRYPIVYNPNASDFESKKKRLGDISRERYADGTIDSMKTSFSIGFRIKEEIGKDDKPYHS